MAAPLVRAWTFMMLDRITISGKRSSSYYRMIIYLRMGLINSINIVGKDFSVFESRSHVYEFILTMQYGILIYYIPSQNRF